jgi:hypothetical protein
MKPKTLLSESLRICGASIRDALLGTRSAPAAAMLRVLSDLGVILVFIALFCLAFWMARGLVRQGRVRV